ncbi:MAG: uracil-DNA glycosylase [Victivallales bacterium]|nr:uracil-DNA glycosylase [Victivallales bacterium]
MVDPFFLREQRERLDAALAARYAAGEEIYPARENIFHALEATRYRDVRAVWLGQDPYHEPGQAIGLAFAVPNGTKCPPSLRNIFKEYSSDLNTTFLPTDTTLAAWARHGVLLLNTVLSVRAHAAASHRSLGWQDLTGAVVQAVNDLDRPVAFILLGNDAKAVKPLIDGERHIIFEAAHPSPLSAHRGFFGSRPFSTINRLLEDRKAEPIDWRLD